MEFGRAVCCLCGGCFRFLGGKSVNRLRRAAEDVDVVTALCRGLDQTDGAHLMCLRLGFREGDVGVCRRVGGVGGEQTEGVVGLHDGITRHAIDADGVVGWHLRVVFGVVQTAVEGAADAGVGGEDVAFAVEFEGDAVGVLMVAKRGIEREHEVVAGVHAGTECEPRHGRGMEKG